jgi:hypothetical protein
MCTRICISFGHFNLERKWKTVEVGLAWPLEPELPSINVIPELQLLGKITSEGGRKEGGGGGGLNQAGPINPVTVTLRVDLNKIAFQKRVRGEAG